MIRNAVWLLVKVLPRRASEELGSWLTTGLFRWVARSRAQRIRIASTAKIMYPRRVQLGDGTYIGPDSVIVTEDPTSTLKIGSEASIGAGVHLDYTGGLVIGDSVLLSEGAKIYSHDHGHDPRSEARKRSVIIDDGAWVGTGAIVLTSCQRIGKRAVIGAGSVVTKPVGDGEIFVGSSATKIGSVSSG